ncbi:hypothetical protein FN846DRAFT_902243 [Sphaerosporella brunnea]|uniref:Uncharacterized protein n=1 Tax=Sphaerosporella brunnea TaxID=1250544 RepID=A0A5J5F9G7_9PEZI|nr:hypothetical protein FN846DRAFT_902243 [Sphaerosporella brunnea]
MATEDDSDAASEDSGQYTLAAASSSPVFAETTRDAKSSLAVKLRDRCNTIRWLACKTAGYNLPNLATLDVDLEEIRPLPVSADATKWQQNAEDWTFLATEWRSRYNGIVDGLPPKTPERKATNFPPLQKISLQTQACMSDDYRVEPEPTLVTAGGEDVGRIAAGVTLPAVEDFEKNGGVTNMSARSLENPVMETSSCLAEVSEPTRPPQHHEYKDLESIFLLHPCPTAKKQDGTREVNTSI